MAAVDLMNMCMKRCRELSGKGDVEEADALSAAAFTILHIMANAVKMLQSNGTCRFLVTLRFSHFEDSF